MFRIKKFLAVTLILSIIFNLSLETKVFSYESGFDVDKYLSENCSERNFNGGYLRQGCAGIEAQKILLSGEKDFLVMRDLGALGDCTFYYFTFNALDRILDELGIDSDEDNLRQEYLDLEERVNNDFSKLKVLPSVGASALIGVLGGDLLFKSIKTKEQKRKLFESKDNTKTLPRNNVLTRLILNAGVGVVRLVGALCGALIPSILLHIKYKSENKKLEQIWEKKTEIYKMNEKRADVLNVMLSHIKSARYLDRDFFAVRTSPNHYWTFDSGNVGLNYTEEEKANLHEKMKKLAQDIEENLGRRVWRD